MVMSEGSFDFQYGSLEAGATAPTPTPRFDVPEPAPGAVFIETAQEGGEEGPCSEARSEGCAGQEGRAQEGRDQESCAQEGCREEGRPEEGEEGTEKDRQEGREAGPEGQEGCPEGTPEGGSKIERQEGQEGEEAAVTERRCRATRPGFSGARCVFGVTVLLAACGPAPGAGMKALTGATVIDVVSGRAIDGCCHPRARRARGSRGCR